MCRKPTLPRSLRLREGSSGGVHSAAPWTVAALALIAATALAGDPGREAAAPLAFVEVAEAAGVQVRDLSGGPDKVSLLDTVGHGAAWLDFDSDGLYDLFVANGSTLARLRGEDRTSAPSCRLLRNLGGGKFADATERAGVGGPGFWGMGAAVGDADNDGRPDLFVTGFGRNVFYRNRGDGTFEDATARAGLAGGGWSTSAAFGDYDRDGRLDLFVARYVEFDVRNFPTGCLYAGLRVACGPMGFRGEPDLLYRNNGDGTFTDVSRAAGILAGEPYFGLGALFLDYDRDGRPDIYVANDATPANLWHNEGDGRFVDRGTLAGCAFSGDGKEQARMGVDAADYDRSGAPSLFTTNFAGEPNSLFRSLGNGFFTDATDDAGLGGPSIPLLGWGTRFVDYDNDGWLDLFVVNGHLYPEVDGTRAGSYRQPIQVFRNLAGRFREVGGELGLRAQVSGRGAAFADYDNDGDLDAFVVTMDGLPLLLENRGGNRGGFLVLRLAGRTSNRDGYGAQVRVTVDGTVRSAEARAAGSYLSSHDPRVHFGLGQAREAARVEVVWPSGTRDLVEHVAANQFLTVVEGQGIARTGAK